MDGVGRADRGGAAQSAIARDDLLAGGPLSRLGTTILIEHEVASTNTLLLRRAAELPDGALAWTEFQTGGRGRLGRRWEAPRGASILLSTLVHEPADAALVAGGALLACVAACEALDTVGDLDVTIRWPNDLYVRGRKLGGVLAESCLLPGSPPRRAVVIGVGINCLQHRGHFAGALAERATSVDLESTQPVNRAAIAAALVQRLDAWLAAAERAASWTALRAAWHARCGDFGTRVTLQHDGRTFSGTAVDVSIEGDLVVQLDHGGRRHFGATTTTRSE
jgi:BirA family biotin operon repressor/biotin-[acetyl-CoA-carboxylase] ligase